MQKVMGQTGRVVLSDDAIKYARSKKRTVRYWYVRMGKKSYRAEVVGPFHSELYGVCGFGTTKVRAKEAMKRNLSRNYRYFGHLLLSVTDTADTVGIV